ncbi:conserved hypothetical protein [Pediculus humanus corporis]|uniref:Protein pinocchio n=1 Tax=Pediculus humanus subsp. corporis TaxID=121224 RepID=E0W1L2_PEDHC|nr:uncharacterized protein Phum_PHUM578690 [Pediculus humanus corporis]EEB19518.1 conserved hypothetical protein [Pediculus humanus corporis]
MSLAGVRPLGAHSATDLINRSHSYGALSALSRGSYESLSSLDDVHHFLSQSEQAVLSIEELRLQLNSCFTCGVSWQDEHVSLDCSECGGYSLVRPCPTCEGRCDSIWKRDLTMTHASGKARWEGKCGLDRSLAQTRIILQSLSLSPPEGNESHQRSCQQRLDNNNLKS